MTTNRNRLTILDTSDIDSKRASKVPSKNAALILKDNLTEAEDRGKFSNSKINPRNPCQHHWVVFSRRCPTTLEARDASETARETNHGGEKSKNDLTQTEDRGKLSDFKTNPRNPCPHHWDVISRHLPVRDACKTTRERNRGDEKSKHRSLCLHKEREIRSAWSVPE